MVSAVVFSYFSLGSIKPAYFSTDADKILISYPSLLDNLHSICSHFRVIYSEASNWQPTDELTWPLPSPWRQDFIILYVFSDRNNPLGQ